MVYQIWVHFIIFFIVNCHQDWTNSWYAAKQTYKIAPYENHKKKDGGGEKKQKKIRAMNCQGEYDSENQSCNFIVFFPLFLDP